MDEFYNEDSIYIEVDESDDWVEIGIEDMFKSRPSKLPHDLFNMSDFTFIDGGKDLTGQFDNQYGTFGTNGKRRFEALT